MGSGNIKKFEIRLGRTGLIIVIGGMTVLLCLSFLLGVGVGKNIDTYPEKISSIPQQFLGLFWRPAKMAGGQSIAGKTEAKPDSGNMDLTFHKALTSQQTVPIQPLPDAEKTPDDAAVMGQQSLAPAPLPPLPRKEEAVSAKKEADGQKVLAGEKLSAENKSKTKEDPSPAHPAGSFHVYVVSLKDKVKAGQIHKIVAGLGYTSKIVKVDIKGKGTWYRVIATGFETKARAQAAADRISKKVKTNCIIRQAALEENRKPSVRV